MIYVLSNYNNNIFISMYINSIASIRRAVLDLIIDLSCQHGTTRSCLKI